MVLMLVSASLVAGAAWSQDQAPAVAPIESRRTMVPVPKVGRGAPYYSTEQLEAERQQANRNIACLGNDARRRANLYGRYGGIGYGTPGYAWGRPGGVRELFGAYGGPYYRDAYGDGFSRYPAYRNTAFDRQAVESQIAFHARKAANATLAAEDARRKAAEGLVSAAEVERAELARQSAVRYYDTLMGRQFGLGYDPTVGLRSPVAIEVASATIRDRNGREVIQVAGRIRNTRERQTRIPTVTLAVYDLDGNLTMATAAQASSRALSAGEARPFAIEIPAWKDAARVEVRPGMLAPFQGDRDFCRSGTVRGPLEAAERYERLQDDLRFVRPPGEAGLAPNAATVQRRP